MSLPTYTAYHDATQESSSQSSSADNGDPHTPSPQYSQSVANHATPLVDDIAKAAMPTDSIDPHFARLLSSLTMSATAVIDNKVNDKPVLAPLSIKANEPAPEPSTPVPVTTSSTGSHPLPDPADQTDWSASVPTRLSDRPGESSIPPTSVYSGLSLIETDTVPPRPPVASGCSFQPPLPLHSIPRSNGLERNQQPLHSAVLPSSPVLSTVSPRSLSSHRTSSTADISPYLSRPAELPTSAKRLKQLALLESVADESAKMSPFLTHRAPAFGGNVNGVNPISRHQFVPGPSASVPPHSMIPMGPNDLRVIYSSDPVAGRTLAGPPSFNGPSHPATVHDDPFQVRPRTSHNVQRGSMYAPAPGSVSMNQSQLLTLMNGSRATPVQTSSIYPQPSHVEGPYRSTFYHPPPAPQHSLALHAGLGQSPLNPFYPRPFPVYTPAPLSAPADSPGFDLPPHNTSHLNSNAQLLSILNGSRATPSLSNTPAYPPFMNNRA